MNANNCGYPGCSENITAQSISGIRPLRSRSPAFESAYRDSYSSYLRFRPRLIDKLMEREHQERTIRINEEERRIKRSRSFISDGENFRTGREIRPAYESVFGLDNATRAGYMTRDEREAMRTSQMQREMRYSALQEYGQAPPQTVELYEGSDDEDEDATRHNIANKLGGPGAQGYIDTIVNFDEKEGELNISNVVKIGDQLIRKDWN